MVQTGSFVKGGFKRQSGEILIGMMKGFLDIIFGRYPKRITTLIGALPKVKTDLPSVNRSN
jgi:hypothetical protein